MRLTENGIYTGIPREEYDRIDRLNWSLLKHIGKSPAHFRAAQLERETKDTDSLKLGRAVHVIALEPDRFFSTFAVWDGGTRRGKEWDKFKEKNEGLELIREEEYQLAKALAEAARSHEHAAKYLRDGTAEATMLWTTRDENGVEFQCKGRTDFATNAGALVDLKTTRDASPEAFARQCWDMEYAAQAAFYVDGCAAAKGIEPNPFIIVAVEKDAPHVVQVYRIPEHILEMGRDTYRKHLSRLATCRALGRWPAYSDGELELTLPSWMEQDNTAGMGLVFEEGETDAAGL